MTARDASSSDEEYAYVPARAHASAAAPAPTAAPALSEAVYWAVTTPNGGSYCKKGGGSYCKKGDAPPAPVTVTAPDSRFWDAVPPGDGVVGWESSGGMDTVDAASDAASEPCWSDGGDSEPCCSDDGDTDTSSESDWSDDSYYC